MWNPSFLCSQTWCLCLPELPQIFRVIWYLWVLSSLACVAFPLVTSRTLIGVFFFHCCRLILWSLLWLAFLLFGALSCTNCEHSQGFNPWHSSLPQQFHPCLCSVSHLHAKYPYISDFGSPDLHRFPPVVPAGSWVVFQTASPRFPPLFLLSPLLQWHQPSSSASWLIPMLIPTRVSNCLTLYLFLPKILLGLSLGSHCHVVTATWPVFPEVILILDPQL